MPDWYDTARKEFLFDLAAFNDVPQDAADRVYAYLNEVGLVDYDIEKEFLYDNYVEDGDKDES